MKKLLLITFLFLITPDAKANMDNICEGGNYVFNIGLNSFIAKNCERNNILRFSRIQAKDISTVISSWCRHDREINFVEIARTRIQVFDTDEWLVMYDFVCVLYDTKPRKIIE